MSLVKADCRVGAVGSAVQPGADAQEIESRRRDEGLEGRLGLPQGARVAQVADPHSLGMRPLDPGTLPRGRGKGLGLLSRSCPPQREFLLARMPRNRAPAPLGAALSTRTGKTIRRREPDRDHLACLPMPPVVVHRPTGAGMPVRTDGALGVPVDPEVVPREAIWLLRLPAVMALAPVPRRRRRSGRGSSRAHQPRGSRCPPDGSAGSRPRRATSSWMGMSRVSSATAPGVVVTWTRRCGVAGSPVSVTGSLEPTQLVSRFLP